MDVLKPYNAYSVFSTAVKALLPVSVYFGASQKGFTAFDILLYVLLFTVSYFHYKHYTILNDELMSAKKMQNNITDIDVILSMISLLFITLSSVAVTGLFIAQGLFIYALGILFYIGSMLLITERTFTFYKKFVVKH